jgi:hypothetical protein
VGVARRSTVRLEVTADFVGLVVGHLPMRPLRVVAEQATSDLPDSSGFGAREWPADLP